MSLRNRLLALVLAVMTVGMVAAGLIVNAVVGITLDSRAVDQLSRADEVAERVIANKGTTGWLGSEPNKDRDDHGPDDGPGGPGGITALTFDASNQVADRVDPAFATAVDAASIPVSVLNQARAGDGVVRFTMGDYVGDAKRLSDGETVLVTMVSTSGSAETMHQLMLTELAVGAGVLILVGVGSAVLLRVGLKPLRAMANTADNIANGDTSQRVPRGGGAEVDTLAASLNSAFDSRDASENRLRTFIADASHELRTPLTSIRGYAQLIERGMLQKPEDVQSAAGRIERESSRLGGMVSTLLSLTRLDLGRSLEMQPVELTVLAADAISDARVGDPQRTYSLHAKSSAPVLGDESQLRQVLANLMGNARDHTEPGTAVRIQVYRDGERVVLEVADHGAGVPDEFKGKVFDRFFRMDAAHGRSETGHGGLGLPIVQAIVNAHGGTVSVHDTDIDATEGATGATFRISLPVAPHIAEGADDDESYDDE